MLSKIGDHLEEILYISTNRMSFSFVLRSTLTIIIVLVKKYKFVAVLTHRITYSDT